MYKTGSQLKFISWIKRDGSGTEKVERDHIEVMKDEKFEVHTLSLTEGTFIAHGFNSFVVRLRPEPIPPKNYDEYIKNAVEFANWLWDTRDWFNSGKDKWRKEDGSDDKEYTTGELYYQFLKDKSA